MKKLLVLLFLSTGFYAFAVDDYTAPQYQRFYNAQENASMVISERDRKELEISELENLVKESEAKVEEAESAIIPIQEEISELESIVESLKKLKKSTDDYQADIALATNKEVEARKKVEFRFKELDGARAALRTAKNELEKTESNILTAQRQLQEARQDLIDYRTSKALEELSKPRIVTASASLGCNDAPAVCIENTKAKAEQLAAEQGQAVVITAVTEIENGKLTKDQARSFVSAKLSDIEMIESKWVGDNARYYELKAVSTPVLTDELKSEIARVESVFVDGLSYLNPLKAVSMETTTGPADSSSSSKADAIKDLLAKLGQSKREGRFYLPPNRSVYSYAEEILALDFSNAEAQQALTEIPNHLEKLVKSAIANESPQSIYTASLEVEEGLKYTRGTDQFTQLFGLKGLIDDYYAEQQNASVQIQPQPIQQVVPQPTVTVDAPEANYAEAKQAEINELLEDAERAIRNGDFFLPRSRSAYGLYSKVLTLEEDNTKAKIGLSSISREIEDYSKEVKEKEDTWGVKVFLTELDEGLSEVNKREHANLYRTVESLQKEFTKLVEKIEKQEALKSAFF
jgi:DNA repair exonuclease SbcCD ATPase subunit